MTSASIFVASFFGNVLNHSYVTFFFWASFGLAARARFQVAEEVADLCRALLEAVACGLPAVVSDHVGSAPDLVVDGENGAVFPRGDAPALAAALDRVLSDPAERRRMGDRSAERSLGFTHEACVEAFLDAVRAATRTR